MTTVRPSEERGHANHGWLDSYHTFSFGDYRDSKHTQFSVLRVINQDRVEPGGGFPKHGHKDMEIISYVLDGVLEHKDSMGTGSQVRPGDVQLMSAGTGVTHSEFNGSKSEPLAFLQMWIIPKNKGTEPRYEQKPFPESDRQGKLRLVVSPDGRDGSVTIGQDICLYASLLDADESTQLDLAPGRKAWLHVATGSLTLNGTSLGPGDGAAIEDETKLSFEGRDRAEFVLFDLPGDLR